MSTENISLFFPMASLLPECLQLVHTGRQLHNGIPIIPVLTHLFITRREMKIKVRLF